MASEIEGGREGRKEGNRAREEESGREPSFHRFLNGLFD